MGLLRAPLQFSFIVNVLGGLPPTVESLQLQKRIALDLAPQSEWEVIGISKCQWRMLATALVLGGNVRVGLEDSIYLRKGVLAESNAAQVEKIIRILDELSLEAATPDEARQMLGLKGAANTAIGLPA